MHVNLVPSSSFFFPFFFNFGKYMCGCAESGVILGRSGALVEGIIHHTK